MSPNIFLGSLFSDGTFSGNIFLNSGGCPGIFAYIDPFTGSILLQILAAGFFGILIFFKRIKYAVLGLFGFGSAKQKTAKDGENTHDIDE